MVRWVAGWLWGGSWEAEFGFFDESLDRERRLLLKFPGGGDAGLQWFLSELSLSFPPATRAEKVDDEVVPDLQPTVAGTLGPEVLVAEELSNKSSAPPEEEGSERGETILIHTGKPEVTDVVRELITVAWVTKCWNERTKSPGLFGNSVKDADKGAGGLKYKW